MKGLLKVAIMGFLSVVVVEIARQWRLRRSDSVPTLRPLADAEPAVAEPLQPEDLRVAQNSPL